MHIKSASEFLLSSLSIDVGYSTEMVLSLRDVIRESQEADNQDMDLSSHRRLIHLHRSLRARISACPATKWVENGRRQLRLRSLLFLLHGKRKETAFLFSHH